MRRRYIVELNRIGANAKSVTKCFDGRQYAAIYSADIFAVSSMTVLPWELVFFIIFIYRGWNHWNVLVRAATCEPRNHRTTYEFRTATTSYDIFRCPIPTSIKTIWRLNKHDPSVRQTVAGQRTPKFPVRQCSGRPRKMQAIKCVVVGDG